MESISIGSAENCDGASMVAGEVGAGLEGGSEEVDSLFNFLVAGDGLPLSIEVRGVRADAATAAGGALGGGCIANMASSSARWFANVFCDWRIFFTPGVILSFDLLVVSVRVGTEICTSLLLSLLSSAIRLWIAVSCLAVSSFPDATSGSATLRAARFRG